MIGERGVIRHDAGGVDSWGVAELTGMTMVYAILFTRLI